MTGEMMIRTAATLGVRHEQRMIDLIAVPYNEPADVLRRGRWVTETIDPEAFTGVHGAVTVNRAHDLESPLGRVKSLRPNDPRGLLAELKISRTSDGDDVLELASDGLLSPSIGFMSEPGGEQWSEDRTAVRVTRAKLYHIAMTGDPAYAGAKVLAVRTADPAPPRVATPNLDRVRLQLLADAHGVGLVSDV